MGKHAANGQTDAFDLAFSTRGLSATEIAAVTAVIAAAVHEQASDEAQIAEPAVSAWQLSARPMRMPLTPGPGAWRNAGL